MTHKTTVQSAVREMLDWNQSEIPVKQAHPFGSGGGFGMTLRLGHRAADNR